MAICIRKQAQKQRFLTLGSVGCKYTDTIPFNVPRFQKYTEVCMNNVLVPDVCSYKY